MRSAQFGADSFVVEVLYEEDLFHAVYMKVADVSSWGNQFKKMIESVESLPFKDLPLHIYPGTLGYVGHLEQRMILKRLEAGI